MGSHEKLTKVFVHLIGWLLTADRRPGMLGKAVALSSAPDRAEVIREGDRWFYMANDGNQREVNLTALLELVGQGRFEPRFVHVEPDLAPLLFQQAVTEAEESIRRVHEGARYVEELRASTKEYGYLMPFVLGGAALDRAVQASISAVVLAVAAGEAQLNRWAAEMGGWKSGEDWEGLPQKCKILAQRKGQNLDLGRGPLQELQQTVSLRNDLVHSKPVPTPIPATGDKAPSPGRTMSIEARRSCRRVREALVVTARALDFTPPGYLAYCPPGDPSDDEEWRGAVVLTGTRHDPDFPIESSD